MTCSDKSSLFKSLLLALPLFLAACSTNPATGERQFTALMPPSQEAAVGAQEHSKIEQTFGSFMIGPTAAYVNSVGQKVARNTERTDVQYKFYVIDSPIVNAFALPGGYVYVTRGLLALANSEAELAAVLGHEIGHVTARHSAERFSQSVLAQIGGAALGIAFDSPDAAKAFGVGSELYLKSYSRGQEHQADELGVRYIHRAGYDPVAMASFLESMAMSANLDAKIEGKNAPKANWFSTHPQTESRVAEASAEATKYPKNNTTNDTAYLQAINGLTYGGSEAEGFFRDQTFYHPAIGFTFTYPKGFSTQNTPAQVIGVHDNGAIIVFDSTRAEGTPDPMTYLTQQWMNGDQLKNVESTTVNGKRAAAGSFAGNVNGRSMTVQVMAVEWTPGRFFRFQVAIPSGLDSASLNALKSATYSLREMTAAEKRSIRPDRIQIITARAGDTVSSLASSLPFSDYKEERFRVLNGMTASDKVVASRQYKIITR